MHPRNQANKSKIGDTLLENSIYAACQRYDWKVMKRKSMKRKVMGGETDLLSNKQIKETE